MSSFYEVFNRVFQPYKTILFVLFLVILFGVAAYFVYTNYIANSIHDKKYTDVANSSSRNEAVLVYFFYADWCPHCKTAKPEWEKFSKQVNGTMVNNKTIKTVVVDCTDLENTELENTSVEAKELVRQYNVKGFPTVFAVKDGKQIDYDAKVSLTTLNKFAEAITQ